MKQLENDLNDLEKVVNGTAVEFEKILAERAFERIKQFCLYAQKNGIILVKNDDDEENVKYYEDVC